MHLNSNEQVRKKADKITKEYRSRNADTLAKALGITIMERDDFKKQKGAYVVIERNRYIFLKSDLPEPMRSIVILHEIGHDQLHRKEAKTFHEFSLFDMTGNTMEYEANLFAAHIMLPDQEVIEYITQGYSVAQIAGMMNSDINLVALKAADLSTRGMNLRIPDHKKNFL